MTMADDNSREATHTYPGSKVSCGAALTLPELRLWNIPNELAATELKRYWEKAGSP